MADDEPVSEGEVERAAADVRDHPEGQSLGLLVWDVLGRQTEARSHRGSKQLVRRRAKKHGIARQSANTGLGNLLGVLEKGPQTPPERALLAAYAVKGLAAEVERAEPGETRAALFRELVARADRWEAVAGLGIYPLVERVLPEAQADEVWRAVGEAMLTPNEEGPHARSWRRAADAIRLTALAEAARPAARQALEEVAASGGDPMTRAAATAVLDGAPAAASVPPAPAEPAPAEAEGVLRVEGSLRKVPRTRSVQVLRWISGWALIAWLGRALAGLTGWRRQGSWELDGNVIRIRTRTMWLGRVIRESEEDVSVGSLLAGTRQVRYPWLHLVAGVMTTAVGVLVGVALFHDALRTGEQRFLWIGAAVILASAGLDLLLDALWSGRRRRVVLELRVRQQGRLCLRSVPLEHADRFLERLAARFPEPEGA